MGSGIYISTAGAVAQDTALDVAATNIANASTTGYKAERVTFGQALANTRAKDSAFAAVAAVSSDSSAGSLRRTDNPLDVALLGDGYFGVNTPAGVRYTRAGDFRLDDQGRLVNGMGFVARGSGGNEISVPEGATTVTIDGQGQVIADGDEIGQLEVVRFAPTALRREGDNLYSASGPPAAPEGEPPEIVSGALEQSNVNVVRGMVDLVKVSRAYESLMRMIQGYRDMESAAARGIGRPR
ncbi:MAG TPA: flagellar basal-body rod protein FlgF [Kofleriaceae bacterium]|nr:flagellar basal-body rod protein FlgF [Kofleriaceae bacterium]